MLDTQADAAGGVHPGSDAVADWSPYAHRAGHPFDELYAKLRPEIDAIVAQYEQKRSALLPMAHLFQEHEGFLSSNALAVIAHTVAETPATVESTVSFYSLFFRRPVGKYMVHVCRNLSCLINGAQEIMDYCREKIGVSHLETTDDGVFSYEEVECLAACDRAPCAQVNLEFVYDLTKAKVDQLLADLRAGTHPIQPLVQTVKPGKTWKLSQDTGLKAAGARGVSDPNNAGGIGDPSGVKMFDLIVGKPQYEERSKERLVHETTLRPEIAEGGH